MQPSIAITTIHGVPGAGKGTLAAMLRHHVRHLLPVTCGDLVRNAIKEETRQGLEFKTFLDKGALVPDDLVSDLMIDTLDRLSSSVPSIEFLIDGYPRTPPQAGILQQHCNEREWIFRGVLDLQIPPDLAMERILNRRTCPLCGAIYNLKSHPPAVSGLCDNDKVPLHSRQDETPEQLSVRFANYEVAYTSLSHHYLNNVYSIHRIDATQPAEEVFQSALVAFPNSSGSRSNSLSTIQP